MIRAFNAQQSPAVESRIITKRGIVLGKAGWNGKARGKGRGNALPTWNQKEIACLPVWKRGEACFRIRNKARSCRKGKNPYYIEKAVSHRNDGKPLDKPASGVAISVRPNRSFKNRRASKRRILIIWKSEEATAASGEGDKMERPRPIPAAGLTITFGKCRGDCSYL